MQSNTIETSHLLVFGRFTPQAISIHRNIKHSLKIKTCRMHNALSLCEKLRMPHVSPSDPFVGSDEHRKTFLMTEATAAVVANWFYSCYSTLEQTTYRYSVREFRTGSCVKWYKQVQTIEVGVKCSRHQTIIFIIIIIVRHFKTTWRSSKAQFYVVTCLAFQQTYRNQRHPLSLHNLHLGLSL